MTRWIGEFLLGCFFITVGAMKAFQYRRVQPAMPWLGDVPRGLVVVIGYSELLGGAGLILPGIAGVSLLVIAVAVFGLAVVVLYIVAFNATAAKVIECCRQPPLLSRRRAIAPGRSSLRRQHASPTHRGAAGMSAWRDVLSGVRMLTSAAVYATLIVTFGFQVARVDGLSMAPTLQDQDRLIVNRLVYQLGDPRRGDIVMLYYPRNPEMLFIKRVIAREGDTVQSADGTVYVNHEPLRDDYVRDEFRSHDDWGPQVVQEGYYLVMGDHRNNSFDSRDWGPVPKKYIVGKVNVRLWPIWSARTF